MSRGGEFPCRRPESAVTGNAECQNTGNIAMRINRYDISIPIRNEITY
jgi:hypothetical protein